MVDPVTLVPVILAAVQLIVSAALKARQNKVDCLELAKRTQTLAHVLPSFECAAAKDRATALVLERLKDVVHEALKLIESCQGRGFLSKGAQLNSVGQRINNCILELSLIGAARTNNGGTAAAVNVPAQTSVHVHHYHGSYHQAQGGAAPYANVAWPPMPQGYYHQPTGYPPYYAASAAPLGSNPSSSFALPTVNKFVKDIYHIFR
jgi:hypothetical protein